MAVTFIGHATFLLRTATTVILTDPVFTSHAGPFGRLGPPRVRPPALDPRTLPPVDIVLVSHNHYDHLQPSSLRVFRDTATFVAPLGVGRLLDRPPDRLRQGYGGPPKLHAEAEGGGHKKRGSGMLASASSQTRVASGVSRTIKELDWWQSTRVGTADITCVPAQHFSARTPWDRNLTLWCGFVVRVDGVALYFAADSGYTPQFREIGERCPSIDVALLPIGAYEPRWFMASVHMNPEEAVRAHLDVRARVSVGMHFGTFQLTDEGIDEPVRAVEQAREAAGVSAGQFRVLDFGESVVI